MKDRRVVIAGKGRAELEKFELVGDLASNEILVQSECSFISAGTELSIYTAKEGAVYVAGSWCAYPWTAGYANVGRVEEIGCRVTRTTVGERVFTFGPHASSFRYSQENLVFPVPESMDPGLAAASRMAGVATSAMAMADRTLYRPSVLVFGLGMVGNLAAQVFQLLGAQVLGIDPSLNRRRIAEECGVGATSAGDKPEIIREALQRVSGKPQADLCIEATGLTPVVLNALSLTANVGQLILLGTPRAPMEGNLTAAFSEIHLRNICVRGALEWCLPVYPPTGPATLPMLSLWEKQRLIFEWMKSGELLLEPMISHRLPPSQITSAYDGLLNESEIFTGVVLDWR